MEPSKREKPSYKDEVKISQTQNHNVVYLLNPSDDIIESCRDLLLTFDKFRSKQSTRKIFL